MKKDKIYAQRKTTFSKRHEQSPYFLLQGNVDIFMFCLACCSTIHGLALRSCFLFFYFHSLVFFVSRRFDGIYHKLRMVSITNPISPSCLACYSFESIPTKPSFVYSIIWKKFIFFSQITGDCKK